MKKKNLFLKSTSSLLAMLFVVMSAFMFTACDDKDDPDPDDDPEPVEGSVFEVIADSESHTQLEAFLNEYPDLVDVLSDTTANITAFAPNDDAFENLRSILDVETLESVNPAVIEAVLAFHVHTAGQVLRADIDESTSLSTAQGESITFNANGNVATGGTNTDVQFVGDEIVASNGVVHVVATILIPPTIFETIGANLGQVSQTILLGADFSTLAAAIAKADTYASAEGKTILTELLSDGEANLTVFAPVNQVFEAGGLTLDSFTAEQWYGLITNHILDQRVASADLDGTYTSLAGGPIEVVEGGLNSNGIPGPEAPIAVADIDSDNGVVHAIAGVLSPPTLVYAAVNLNENFSTLKAAIDKADEYAESADEPTLFSILTDTEATLTVFAPVNDVFAAASITVESYTGAEWYGLIANHVITSEAVASADLTGVYTSAAGSPITVLPSGGLDSDGEAGAEATIAAADAFVGSNGIVHGIAGILVLPTVSSDPFEGTFAVNANGIRGTDDAEITWEANVTIESVGGTTYAVSDITFGGYLEMYTDGDVNPGEMTIEANGDITITDVDDVVYGGDVFNGSGTAATDGSTMTITVSNGFGDSMDVTLTKAGSRISFDKEVKNNNPIKVSKK